MLAAAAVCPFPPLLLPEVAGGAARELDGLRSACDEAVSAVLAAEPDVVLLVGSAEDATRRYERGAAGSLAPYGVDLRVPLGADEGRPPELPLSLTVGAWLVARGGWDSAVAGWAVPDAEPGECMSLGARLADEAPRVGMVALGDGSARRSEKAPGYVDPRAAPFDAQVATVLACADPEALLSVDAGLARELLAVGRSVWHVLAGAAADGGVPFDGRVLYHDAPYGVGYLVATWVRATGMVG